MDYITAGDANGQALVALVQGIPAGLRLIGSQVESDLHRCLQGYGAPAGAYRYVEIESGLCGCITSGAPVAFLVYGDDASSDEGGAAEGCVGEAGASLAGEAPFAIPRPGRGDLAAVLKTAADAVETVTTRLDAYDQAACVVAASVPREFLAQLGVEISSFVSGIGSACHLHRRVGEGIPPLMWSSRPFAAPTSTFPMKWLPASSKRKRKERRWVELFRLLQREYCPAWAIMHNAAVA